jgi:hypothetical protein
VPAWVFIPNYHWLLFFVCRISGSRVCVAFLVELAALMMVASTMGPAGQEQSSRRLVPFHRRGHLRHPLMLLEQMPKAQDRRFAARPVPAQLHPREAPPSNVSR